MITSEEKLKNKIFKLRMCNISLSITVLLLFLLVMINNNRLVYKYDILVKEMEKQEEYCLYLEEKSIDLADTVTSTMDINSELDKQNKSLVKSNEEYLEIINEYSEREELHNKYEYALFDDGNRNDITYDHLRTLEDLMADSTIKDEDLILSIIMTESRGTENARNINSTAKGFGQILNGTSKFVYCELMNNDKKDWYPDIALDGDTNIEMVVHYMDYLYERTGNNLLEAIYSYRGLKSTGYVNKINSYLSAKNKSIQSIGNKE